MRFVFGLSQEMCFGCGCLVLLLVLLVVGLISYLTIAWDADFLLVSLVGVKSFRDGGGDKNYVFIYLKCSTVTK